MMDVVSIALIAVVPVLTLSLWLVRSRRHYLWHKRLQIGTAYVLGIALLFFEIDIRLDDWRPRARPSPYYETWLFPLLYGHLVVAVTTTGLWVYTIVLALKRFPKPPGPHRHSQQHRLLGRVAA